MLCTVKAIVQILIMKRLIKYIVRAVIAAATALLLTLFNVGITLPVNVLTVAVSVLLGVPGIVLSVILCNYIF